MTARLDSAPTMRNLQGQGSGLSLPQLTLVIFRILGKLDIRLQVAHTPGKEKKN
jgi:hypothetical protein